MKTVIPLRGAQKRVVKLSKDNPYMIYAMDVGTGKSLTALECWRRYSKERLLIIAPAGLVLSWRDEIRKWYGDKYTVTVFTEGKKIYPVFDSDIVITSYELGTRLEYLYDWCKHLVIDEAHELKNMESARTQFYHRIIYQESIPRVNLLTGTPIKNRTHELYSLLCICYYNPLLKNPKFLEKFPDMPSFANRFSFREKFSVERFSPKRKKMVKVPVVRWTGHRRVKELKEYMKGVYVRVEMSEILDLPPVIVKDVMIKDTQDVELAKEYKRLARLYDDEEAMAGARRKLESAIEKVPFTIKYVKELQDQVGCVLVYSDHIPSAKLLAEGLGVVALTGESTPKQKHQAVKDFQEGKTDFLVMTIGSMSTGHTIIRAWNTVLNDDSWVPANTQQVIGRTRRLGQKRQVVLHRMFGSPQDKAISDTQMAKLKTIKAIV